MYSQFTEKPTLCNDLNDLFSYHFANSEISELECRKVVNIEQFKRLIDTLKKRNYSCTQIVELDKIDQANIRQRVTSENKIKQFLRNEDASLSTQIQKLTKNIYKENVNGFKIKQCFELKNTSDFYSNVFTYRLKKRYSFQIEKQSCSIAVELSNVKESFNAPSLKSSDLFKQKEKFECELELQSYRNTNTSSVIAEFMQTLKEIICILENIPVFSEKKEIDTILTAFSELFPTECLARRWNSIGPSVISFSHKHMNEEWTQSFVNNFQSYAVSYKADGIRHYGMFHNSKLYFIDMKGKCYFTGIECPLNENTYVFDGEYVDTLLNSREPIFHYLIFDCYVYENLDIRNLSLEERLEKCNSFCNNSTFSVTLENTCVKVKPFYSLNAMQLQENILKSHQDMQNCNYNTDGLIFTHQHELQSSLKWKPKSLLSIDFQIEKRDSAETSIIIYEQEYVCIAVNLYVSRSYYSVFDYFQDDLQQREVSKTCLFSDKGYICFKNKTMQCINDDYVTFENEILELVQIQTNYWIPLKRRYDKIYPNAYVVAEDNNELFEHPIELNDILQINACESSLSQNIYDNIDYKTRNHTKQNMKKMAQVHQSIKHEFIEQVSTRIQKSFDNKSHCILDLSCGRWGDINTWTNYLYSLSLYIGIDISENELTDMKGGACSRLRQYRRSEKGKFDDCVYLFLQGDCSKDLSAECTSKKEYKNLYNFLWNSVPHESFPLKLSGIAREKFHGVSMQFALHYFCSPENNYSSLRQLAKNITMNLKENGFFFGTCFDWKHLHSLFQANKYQKLSCANDTCYIEYITSSEIDVYIDSIGQKIREYTVDFEETIIPIFKEYGLIFLQKTLFASLGNSWLDDVEYQKFYLFSQSNCTFIFQYVSN